MKALKLQSAKNEIFFLWEIFRNSKKTYCEAGDGLHLEKPSKEKINTLCKELKRKEKGSIKLLFTKINKM